MKLNEFISNVLQDIDRGLHEAKEKTDRKYFVESGQNRGVHFDIAVTTTTSTGSQAEGNAKASIIQVLGAGVGAKVEDKNENSQISRIQFSVYVPPETTTEYKRETLRRNNDQW
jgi:hypothetical protein